MKSQRGVTLTSLAIYLILIFIILAILAVVTASFQNGIKESGKEGTEALEINKFNMYFLQEVKKQGNEVIDISGNGTEITFLTKNKYVFDSENNIIDLIELNEDNTINKTIQISENIENCTFSSNLENGKTVISVTIKVKNAEEKTIEYVLNNETYVISYEDENNYIKVEESDDVVVVDLPTGLVEGSEFEMDADQDGEQETWIVLYDGRDGDNHLAADEIEVISKNVMGEEVTLGSYDQIAIDNAEDLDEDGEITDIDIAIYSFENSVETLNNYCASLIKIKNQGVRSVGSLPSNPNYVNTTHTLDTDNPATDAHVSEWPAAAKATWDKYKVLAGTIDTNYESDFNKMGSLNNPGVGGTKNIRVAQNSVGKAVNYWLASRYVYGYWNTSYSYGYVYFNMWYVFASGNRIDICVWGVYSDDYTYANSPSNAVRPIIKLQYQ